MEPNKFEKYIKKQLREREIRPSSEAWERLSKKLDDVDPPARKRNYLWYGVAASFIGLLIISVLYFGLEDQASVPDGKVVENESEKNEVEPDANIWEEKEGEKVVVENDKVEQPLTSKIEATVKVEITERQNQISSVEDRNDAIIDASIEKTITSNNFKKEVINLKVLEIVAAIDSLEQNNDALTEAEVDDLLRNAQEEILRDRLFEQNVSVDAMALLTEVEGELDQSFRDRIFESLKEGFLKVRTAVADRNK